MHSHASLVDFFRRFLARRAWSAAGVLLLTLVAAWFGAGVRADFSVEQAFPRFSAVRLDYERFKQDFPYDDARALVAVEAPDLFSAAGLGRVAELERDLSRIAGVLDTRGLSTVKDLGLDGDALRMDKLFPRGDLAPEELARRRAVATSDPLFAWTLAPPDGRATVIEVTLDRETAGSDVGRTRFLLDARKVLAVHAERAQADGAAQRLTLGGIPIIRAEAIEMIGLDLQRLFPIALLVVILLLYATFRSVPAVLANVVAIVFSLIWTAGAMGACGVPLQVLTQATPVVVLVISLSDSVHVISQYRSELARGVARSEAIALACSRRSRSPRGSSVWWPTTSR